jgi:hypothetical protein
MTSSLSFRLPYNIILYILQFDNRFIIKGGKILDINKISYDDYRYLLLERHIGNNCFVNKYDCSSTTINGEISMYIIVNLIINNKKMYEFVVRHLYLNGSVHIRRHLMLRTNGIATEKYIDV